MQDRKRVHIVASPRRRTGNTLLARLVADRVLLKGGRCRVFDADAADRRLAAYFPEATVIDIERAADQMKLFDTLAAPSAAAQVVDVGHRAFRKFFDLAAEFEYFTEAKAGGVESVIFFLPDNSVEAYDAGLALAQQCRNAGFVLVSNAALGETARDVRNSASYAALTADHPRLRLAGLDPFFVAAMEDPRLSLSDFMRRSMLKQTHAPLPPAQMSLAYLSLETRTAVTAWLQAAFDGIDRALGEIDLRDQVAAQNLAQDPVGK